MAATLALFILLLVRPSILMLSNERHAPLLASLGIAFLIGAAGQMSKLCFIGGFRNFFLIGDYTLLAGFAALVISSTIANVFLGQLHWGVSIIGLSDFLWSFLALTIVGLASVFLGGCPFRQLVLASQGDSDAALGLTGIMVGAAISYNYGLSFIAGSLDRGGKMVIVAGLAGLAVFGAAHLRRS